MIYRDEVLLTWLCAMRVHLDPKAQHITFCMPSLIRDAMVARGWLVVNYSDDSTARVHVTRAGAFASDVFAPECGCVHEALCKES